MLTPASPTAQPEPSQYGESFSILRDDIVCCARCPRLVAHRTQIAAVKRRAFRDWDYWGKPVPGFGDPKAQLYILGLAPAAHGANRTGRVFTGDRSGDLLYKVLYDTGFASQPESRSRDDGLLLTNAYIGATARCAPPGNKPTPVELAACSPFLERELDLLANRKVIVALGQIAFNVYLSLLKAQGRITRRSEWTFGHNREHRTGAGHPVLLTSYHPSQQNTSTGKLNEAMLKDVFLNARRFLTH